MKKNLLLSFLAVSSMMLVLNGCATQEVVKKDESGTTAVTAAPAKPAVKSEPAAKQAQVKVNEVKSDVKPAPKAGEVKAKLEKIYFDFDAHTLSAAARDALAKNSEIMKKNSAVTVRIEGHCDERGSDAYNIALGEKRAKAAMQYLTTLGIPEKRLSVISYGKEKPAVTGTTEASWAKNRRDEFVIQ